MTQNRIQTFDLLKGLAVVLMIQVHIVELFAVQSIYDSQIGKLLLFLGGPPVAPIFLIAFGFFIAKSSKSPLQLVKRGLIILFIGLLLNIALNFNLILSVFLGKFQIDVVPYIFGVDILINAGTTLLLMAFVKKFFKQNIIPLLILIIISAFLGKFLLDFTFESGLKQYLLSVFYGTAWWSYFPVFPWISYTLAGYTFCCLIKDFDLSKLNNLKIKIIFGVSFIIFLFFTLKFAIRIASDLPLYYHHGFIFFLWVIVFAGFYSFFVNEAERLLGKTIVFKYVNWLGKNVTLIYIIQWIIIGNIATEIFKTVASKYYLLLWFVAILTVSSIVGFMLLKVKNYYRKPDATF